MGVGVESITEWVYFVHFCRSEVAFQVRGILLRKKDSDNLERFQRQCLKQIRGLPDNTANIISLALLEILPLEAVLHKNALTTFVNMIRQKGSIENRIVLRQLVMKDENDKCWFMFIRKTLSMYNLPSTFQLFNDPPSKYEWKRLLNNALHSTIEAYWNEDIKRKSSLM